MRQLLTAAFDELSDDDEDENDNDSHSSHDNLAVNSEDTVREPPAGAGPLAAGSAGPGPEGCPTEEQEVQSIQTSQEHQAHHQVHDRR